MNRISAIVIGLLLGILLLSQAAAQNAEFNYNGRVNANGQPFNGSGRFKFTLVSQDGSQTYYANDGITLNGQEPTTYVTATVSNGFFSVNIGDTTIPGMAELDPTIFNAGPVFLRTWFSDGSGFERLTPDRRIVNPGILGIRSSKATTLFVNPATGNDQFSGLQSNRPKRTIQAAWNALPSLIETTTTIQLANGTYRESVHLRGKTCIGDSKIVIKGNLSQPALVRVTGANAGAETVAVRSEGFSITNQSGIILRGMTFDRYANNGVRLTDHSTILLEDSIVHHTLGPGIYLSTFCAMTMNRGEVYETNAAPPIYIDINSSVFMYDSYVHDNRNINGDEYGISVHFSSTLVLKSCRFKNMNRCVEAMTSSAVGCVISLPLNRIEDSVVGFRVEANGTLFQGNAAVTYVNVTTPILAGISEPAIIY